MTPLATSATTSQSQPCSLAKASRRATWAWRKGSCFRVLTRAYSTVRGLDWLGLQGEEPLDLVPAVPPATPGGADGMQEPLPLPGVQGVAVEAIALSHLLGGEEKRIHNKL